MNLMLRCGAAAAALLSFAGAGQAAIINLVDQGGVTGSQSEKGFKIAAAYWSSVLTNNVTINLGVSYAALESGVIGSTGSAGQDYKVSAWEAAVQANANKSALDTIAVLPTLSGGNANNSGAISMITSGPAVGSGGVNTATKRWDTDTAGAQTISDGFANSTATNNKWLYLNTAVVKAIGGAATYDATNTQQLDGEVQFSTAFSFDFDPTDGISAGAMDFIGVAIHEIGHALGFVSGVDYYDYYGRPNGPGRADGLGANFNNYSWFSALDMFRYSTDPTNIAPGTNPVLDLSVGAASYFSIDGGQTQLFGDSRFSTGYYNGDGRQASHWKDATGCGTQIGIMDPTFCYAQMGEVTALDLAAYDAMGWNINFDVLANSGYRVTSSDIYGEFAAGVPEPATWAMMIAGFGFVGASMRRRQRSLAAA